MPESESDEKAQKKKIISISGKEAPASFFCALIEIFAVIIKVFATTVKVSLKPLGRLERADRGIGN